MAHLNAPQADPKAIHPGVTDTLATDSSASDLPRQIGARLRAARRVQIVGHLRPDGDCFGSVLGVHHMLRAWGIETAMSIASMVPGGYAQMPDFALIHERPDPAFQPDLVVYVDCATQERGIEGWVPPAPVINIDHHVSNTLYGDLNWIDPQAASTTEMLFRLAELAGATITSEMAEALLIGLTTDTGSFRFQNAGAPQYRVAAELIERGASPERVALIAFGCQTSESVRLTGALLASHALLAGGKIAWGELRPREFPQLQGEIKVPENLADLLRTIRGVELGMLFSETAEGGLRLNLRSHGAVDVAQFAARWGGGGHPRAAGAHLRQADYEARRDEILAAAVELFR